MEDNSNYTYTYEKEEEMKPGGSFKIVFVAVVVALAVLAVVLGILFGRMSANKEEPKNSETTTEAVTTTLPAEEKSPYKEGQYSVNTDGRTLLFRKEHSKDAESILEIEDKTIIEIEEIYFDEASEADEYKYWGKTTFKGHTGWVAMAYLQKEYSDNVVTPDDVSTTAQVTTTANSAENATAADSESVTTLTLANETSTIESTTQQTGQTDKFTPGDYTVVTGNSTINFRTGPGTNNDTIMSIDDGVILSVTEIKDTGSQDASVRYWGKVTYKGHTGYVCMTYLEKNN